MKLKSIKLNIPLNFNFILIKNLKKCIIIIYNDVFKFKFILNKKNVKINKQLNLLEYNNIHLDKNFYSISNNFFKYLNKLNNYYFLKIKFKGKGYKIGFYKKKKIINFFFGKSHKSIIIYNNIKMKKITKYKFILMGNNINYLKKISYKITNIKKINEYTNRGLRTSRQIIIKRKGKKGSFV